MQRVIGPTYTAQRLDNTASKKRRSDGEPLTILCRYYQPGNRTPDFHTDSMSSTTELPIISPNLGADFLIAGPALGIQIVG